MSLNYDKEVKVEKIKKSYRDMLLTAKKEEMNMTEVKNKDNLFQIKGGDLPINYDEFPFKRIYYYKDEIIEWNFPYKPKAKIMPIKINNLENHMLLVKETFNKLVTMFDISDICVWFNGKSDTTDCIWFDSNSYSDESYELAISKNDFLKFYKQNLEKGYITTKDNQNN